MKSKYTLYILAITIIFSLCIMQEIPIEREFVEANTEFQEFRITTNEDKQYSPAIYKDIVVWTDQRNGNADIYGYRLSTQEEFQITTDPNDQENPAIYGDIVVWEDQRNDRYAIYGFNLSTREEFVISATPHWKSNPAIYGDIVVWEDYGLGRPGIVAYNLSTNEEFQVSENSEEQRLPAIYGDIVVWQDERNHDSFICGYNLSTHEEFRMGEDHSFFLPIRGQYDPAIYKDIVVWTEPLYGNIYGYNLSTSEKFIIAATSLSKCSRAGQSVYVDSRKPKIYENIVVWVDCRNGNEDIYGYDLSTDQEFQITTNECPQHSPAIYGNIVVWKDIRNGNWDIYGADISSSLLITPSKSKTRAIFSDFFWTILWIAFIAVFVFSVARIIWYWKKFSYTSKFTMKPKDFKRNNASAFSPMVLAVLYALVGLLYLSGLEQSYGFLFLILSSVFVVYCFWNKKFPYIRITQDEIMLFETSGHRPRVVKRDAVQKVIIQTWTDLPYKAELLLSNGKKMEIDFSSIDGRDKEDLIQTLRQLVMDR